MRRSAAFTVFSVIGRARVRSLGKDILTVAGERLELPQNGGGLGRQRNDVEVSLLHPFRGDRHSKSTKLNSLHSALLNSPGRTNVSAASCIAHLVANAP